MLTFCSNTFFMEPSVRHIHKIQGKDTRQPVKHLKVNNSIITDTKEIADTLGSTISYNSSSRHYSTNFLPNITAAEKQDIQFPPADEESYNLPISLSELKNSINAAHDSSPCPDFIHYQLLKHLPQSSLIILLNLLNKYWLSDTLPPTWLKATVIPIPKPEKDSTNPNNYRPIALTSCLCKTFERIINNRLMWYLERHNLI